MRVSSFSILKRIVFLPADRLLLRIDANVEVVEEQVVVGAIAAVLAAQDVRAGRRLLRWEEGRSGRWRRCRLG